MELKILRKAERMCGGTGLKTKHSRGRNKVKAKRKKKHHKIRG